MLRRAVATFGLVLAAACAAAGSAAPPEPVIDRLEPDSGPAGTAYPIEVTIIGRDFADSANVVTFGPVRLADLPSREGGTRIVFFAPKEEPSRGEVPPAPLLPGPHDVRVTTAAGTSNAATFTLTPGGLP
jgi:hypothetical protein